MSRVTTQNQSSTKPSTTSAKVPHERIALRAYEKWTKRGCPQGTAMQDWSEAEAELLAETARGTSSGSPARR